MKLSKQKQKKNDCLLIAGLLILTLFLLFFWRFLHHGPSAVVQIEINGTVTETLPLNQDADRILTGVDGGTNHLVIEGGAASITEATCPDKICVHQGPIKETGETIVCLPHRLVITVR